MPGGVGSGGVYKPPWSKARHAADKRILQLVDTEHSEQPALPDYFLYLGEEYDWHPQTKIWWEVWGEHPMAQAFTAVDWQELLDTAIVHSRLWWGLDNKAAAELRARTAAFGATPLARARLRIMFVTADKAEETQSLIDQANGKIKTQRILKAL